MDDELLLTLELDPLVEGGFVATSKELPGLVAQGRTRAEAMEIARDVARAILESYREHGDPLPAVTRTALRRQRQRRTAKATIPVDVEPQPA